MQIADICSREVYQIGRDEPLAQAAREMLRRHVGALVVVEPRDSSAVPVGIVTDRDIVCGQINRSTDLFCATVGDVMTDHPLVIEEGCGIAEAIRHLKARRVRRAPVVDSKGHLVGLISLDDMLPAVAEKLSLLAQLVGHQAQAEGTGARRGS